MLLHSHMRTRSIAVRGASVETAAMVVFLRSGRPWYQLRFCFADHSQRILENSLRIVGVGMSRTLTIAVWYLDELWDR
jgi:hypothetical protein